MAIINTPLNFAGSGQITASQGTIHFFDEFTGPTGIPFSELGQQRLIEFYTATSILGAVNEVMDGLITTSGLISGGGGGGGVATINGISGIITLSSTNNGLEIDVNGQAIEFTPLFTYASGQLVDQNTQDILIVSGLAGGGGGSDAGQTSINGLSGVLVLSSPNGSILIGDGPQAIELSGLFTAASGALLQQHSADLLTLSGLIQDDSGQTSINSTSGAIDLDSPDESININVNGQIIELTTPGSGAPSGASYLLREYNDNGHLSNARVVSATSGVRILDEGVQSISGLAFTLDFDNEPGVNQILSWNGTKLAWVNDQTGGGGGSDAGQTSVNGLSGVLQLLSPNNSILIGDNGQTIELSGLFTSTSGALVQQHSNDLSTLSGLIIDDSGQSSINGLSGVVILSSPNGTVIITPNGQAIELAVLPDAGQTSINGISGVVNVAATNNGINVVDNGQTVELSTLFTYASGQIIDELPRSGTTIEGVSGVVDLSSPDESININVDGQTIELTTPTSGAPSGASYILVDYNDNDHLVDARLLSATSGVILDDQGARSVSGIVIKLDFDDEPAVGEVLTWGGTKLSWTTGAGAGVDTIEGLAGTIDLASPDGTVIINVNGQAIELVTPADAGQTSIRGLSGIVDLDSPDDSINIQVNGQSVELTAPGSGAPSGASYILVDYNDNDHLTSARKLSATSGIALDDKGVDRNDVIGMSGLVIKLDFDNEPTTGQALTWGGSKLQWATVGGGGGVDSLQGLTGDINLDSPNGTVIINLNGQDIELEVLPDTGQTSINGLSGLVAVISPDGSILVGDSPQAIELSGLFTTTSGALTQQHSVDLLTLSGLIIDDSGQTSINGVSGALSLISTNNGINVVDNGQAIELSTLFTYASGQVIDELPRGGTTIEGLSGVVDLDSPDASININVNGQTIELTTTGGGGLDAGQTSINGLSGTLTLTSQDNSILIGGGPGGVEISGLYTATSGTLVQEHSSDLLILSGLILLDAGQTEVNGLSGVISLTSPNSSVDFNTVSQDLQLVVLPSGSKSITVPDPTSSEDLTMLFADAAYTITRMNAVVIGTSPSVTWTVRKNSDRSAAGTEVVTGGTVTTSITTGSDVSTFNSATISHGDWIWLETTATGGTVTQLHLTIHMQQTST
tara:strand:- start:2821 stop:6261 length:3441 start_codon:yes stop_codon:yes gene_type:complete